MSSQFLNDVKMLRWHPSNRVSSISRIDLTVTKTTNNLPLLYKQNVSNGLFTMAFVFDFGNEDDKPLQFSQPIHRLSGHRQDVGGKKIKQEFYKLACGYYISTSSSQMSIVLYGLNENMQKAMNLMENLLQQCQGGQRAYNNYVDLVLKARKDDKLSQETNFSRLRSYGIYGPRNAATDIPERTATQDHESADLAQPDERSEPFTNRHCSIMDLLQLPNWMPSSPRDIRPPKTLLPVPQGKEYTEQTTPKTEMAIGAPYDAKNIFMIQYHSENKQWDPATQPVVSLFNEYFGGGMNTVVFQELRETRGLAYSAYADYATPSRKNHPEYGFTYIISQNDKMMDCIHTFNNILDSVPQSQSAFELAKQALTKSLAAARTTKFSILNRYYWSKKMGLDYDINEKVYNALPSLTLNDIVKFEQQNMANKTYKYLILGDEESRHQIPRKNRAHQTRDHTKEIFGY